VIPAQTTLFFLFPSAKHVYRRWQFYVALHHKTLHSSALFSYLLKVFVLSIEISFVIEGINNDVWFTKWRTVSY